MPVYFIKVEDDEASAPVKIGFTQDISRRLNLLQTANYRNLIVVRLLVGSLSDEARLHKRFQPYRVSGEWFRPHPDMWGDLGLADIPLPPPAARTLRGQRMSEACRAKIARRVAEAWWQDKARSALVTTP